jgi:hypothetical protein
MVGWRSASPYFSTFWALHGTNVDRARSKEIAGFNIALRLATTGGAVCQFLRVR